MLPVAEQVLDLGDVHTGIEQQSSGGVFTRRLIYGRNDRQAFLQCPRPRAGLPIGANFGQGGAAFVSIPSLTPLARA
jgi:hypothetical protein